MKRILIILMLFISIVSFAQKQSGFNNQLSFDGDTLQVDKIDLANGMYQDSKRIMRVQNTLKNFFLGYEAGLGNTTGASNVFVGANAGQSNVSGNYNVLFGESCGLASRSSYNVGVGGLALNKQTTGEKNIGFGYGAGYTNVLGNSNTFIGYLAGYNSLGDNNIFMGNSAGLNLYDGDANIVLGYQAGRGVLTNSYSNNIFIGHQAGYSSTIGGNNVFLGYQAGVLNTTGTGNIFIGYKAGYSNTTTSNLLIIDNDNVATPLIYGDFSADSLVINGKLKITKTVEVDTLYAEFAYVKTRPHGFYAFEDSAVVIDCTEDVWVQITNANKTLFSGIQDGEGFILSGDTIYFNEYNLVGGSPHIKFGWGLDGYAGINEDYEVRIFNVSNSAGVVRKAEGTTTGANNRISIGTTSYDNQSAFGDAYILQIMNKTNSADFTIENGSIFLEVSHY